MRKKSLTILSCTIALIFAFFVGEVAIKTNEPECGNILLQNVEALSNGDDYVDDQVSVRYALDGACWRKQTNYSACNVEGHGPQCQIYTIEWSKDHDMYKCMNISADRYKNGPGAWTLCQKKDLECSDHKSTSKPDRDQGHTTY